MLKLIFTGNLTANPESRFIDTATGQQTVCNFTVAVNRVIRGEKETVYIRVSCWNRAADNAMKYLTKGSKVCVSTSMVKVRAYTTRDGNSAASIDVNADEIEYLSSKPEGTQGGQQPKNEDADEGFMHIPDDLEERVPFR